ncbi:hypothetical protein [Nocardia niwae]|uniref:hypothetical protein n=1 Tax=Nocardia niwae TaxID=626084 RepID=UPI00340A9F20
MGPTARARPPAPNFKTLRIGAIGTGNVLTGPVGFARQRGALLPALKPLCVLVGSQDFLDSHPQFGAAYSR